METKSKGFSLTEANYKKVQESSMTNSSYISNLLNMILISDIDKLPNKKEAVRVSSRISDVKYKVVQEALQKKGWTVSEYINYLIAGGS